MADHFIVKCGTCAQVIRQCKCISQNKPVGYETCDQCNSHVHAHRRRCLIHGCFYGLAPQSESCVYCGEPRRIAHSRRGSEQSLLNTVAQVKRVQIEFADDLIDGANIYEQVKDLVAQFYAERETRETLVALLRESKRTHYHCEVSRICCGACGHESHGGEAARTTGVCGCGADEWNARVDAALK